MGLNDISTKIITLSVCAVMIVAFAVPVIASLNSGGGGGETVTYRNDSGDINYYYRSIDTITDHSALTILSVWDESADTVLLETYPDGSETPIKWEGPYDILSFNESAFNNKVRLIGNAGTQTAWFTYNGNKGNSLQYYGGQFNIPLGSGVQVMTPIPDVAYFSWYEGDYVYSIPDDDADAWDLPNRYVDRSTEIYWTGIYEGEIKICVTGSADNPKALYYDLSAEEYGTADSVVFNIENDVLKSISVVVQGVAHTIWVTYTAEEYSEIDWDVDIDGYDCIVPTTVTVSHGSGSGSSGLDGTLGTLVSVIPLLMVVGLVTVAVALFVRKD